jgi:endonuclease/exonuclease/phosphatase (EEP) superfamily protein YafD
MKDHTYWIIFLLSVFGPLAGLFGRWSWFFDFFSHFRIQQTLLLIIGITWLFLAGQLIKAALALLVLSYCLLSFVKYRRRPRSKVSSFPSKNFVVSVFLANVYAYNKQHEKVMDLIKKENPDIVVLLEVNETWEWNLKEIMKDYGESKMMPREGFYGMAVFSKIPLTLVQEEILDSSEIPSLQCVFEKGDQEIVLWATHPRSPRKARNWRLRNKLLVNLSKRVASDLRPVLVAGDLNTTPWCVWFKVLKAQRLRDSAEGFGIQGTWPTRVPFFMRIPLDHILISPEIQILERRVLQDIGSDHLPIFVRFGIIK